MPRLASAAALAAALAFAAPAAPALADGLPDIWHGSAACGKGDGTIDFQFSRRDDGNYDATLDLLFERAMHGASYEYVYLGEKTATGYNFVVPRGGIRSMSTPQLGEFAVEMTADDSMKISFDGAVCSSARLAPASATPGRYTPTATAPAGRGAYQAATTPRERCEAIVAWTDRLAREFPDLESYKTDADKMYPKLALLWGDDDFVPLFGQPFDMIPVEERYRLGVEFRKQCRREEFVRKRYSVYEGIIDRAFSPEDMKNFGFRALIATIRDQRELRNQLRAASTGAPLTLDAAERLERAAQRGATLLWPSELAGLEETVAALARDNAGTQIAAALAAIEAAVEPLQGLSDIRKLRAAPELAQLDEAARQAAATQLDAAETRFAEAILAPLRAEAEAAPESIAGAAAIQRLIDTRLPAPVAAVAAGAAAKAAFAALVAERVEAYLDARLGELDALPASLAGIEAGALWRAGTASDLAPFGDAAGARAAAAYAEKRAAQLRDALPEFEAGVAGLKSQQEADALLARYFTEAADRAQPIYLEYAFAAAIGG